MQCYKATIKEETILTSRPHGELYTAYAIKDEVSAYVQYRFIYIPLYYLACEDKKIMEHVANLIAQMRRVADTFLKCHSINYSLFYFCTGEGKLIKFTPYISLDHLSLIAFSAPSAASVTNIPLNCRASFILLPAAATHCL